MLTMEEKRMLLRAKLGNPNMPDFIADRFIKNEGNQQVDWSDFDDYLITLKEKVDAK